jgi:ribosomal protein S18 acetylase RimI-like enzyme
VRIRPAAAADLALIARFIIGAGGGLFEFMFDDLVPGMAPSDLLAQMAAQPDSLFHPRHCRIAEIDGVAAGLVNTYPADRIRGETFAQLPADRRDHLAPFPKVQEWGSYYISALSVAVAHRRQGLGRRLLADALAQAGLAGFSRISLHVWDDNHAAAALYGAAGFRRLAHVDLPWHPRLPHRGGMWLMARPLAV